MRILGLFLLAVFAVAITTVTLFVMRQNRQWELSRAADSGDLATVKRLVEAGVPIDAAPTSEAGGGSPAFIVAAWVGHDDIIQYLLDHGANINRRDSCGNTALNAAVIRGHLSTAQLLLSRGANPNIRGEGSPLWNAQGQNNAKMADLLKSYGATQ